MTRNVSGTEELKIAKRRSTHTPRHVKTLRRTFKKTRLSHFLNENKWAPSPNHTSHTHKKGANMVIKWEDFIFSQSLILCDAEWRYFWKGKIWKFSLLESGSLETRGSGVPAKHGTTPGRRKEESSHEGAAQDASCVAELKGSGGSLRDRTDGTDREPNDNRSIPVFTTYIVYFLNRHIITLFYTEVLLVGVGHRFR